MFTVKKSNGVLNCKNCGGFQSRNPSTIWCIQQADAKYNWNDFSEFQVHTWDYEKNPNEYTYSKQNSVHNVVPDFNFHAWPEVGIEDYEKTVESIIESGSHPYELLKVGWIGARTHENRNRMLAIGEQNPHMFDFFDMNWIPSGHVFHNSTKYISLSDLVKKYAILIDIEGNGYSGRLKYLLWSHRPLLLVDRSHKEYFYEHLIPWTHYVPVRQDMSDLVEKTQWILDNYDAACTIAANAREFSKTHLTRDACYAQWNKIITGHASSL